MANNHMHINKSTLLELLDEARELKSEYERQNGRGLRHRYESGSVDEIALRLLERRENFITVGVNSDTVNNIANWKLHYNIGNKMPHCKPLAPR